MKRIELSYGQGEDSFVLDCQSKQLWQYGRQVGMEKSMHETYGGDRYYQSRSGASGAGWIPALPQLLHVGSYRVDAIEQHRVVVGQDENAYSIYVPYNYRRPGECDAPAVIVQDYRVRFCRPDGWAILNALQEPFPGEGRTIMQEFFSDAESPETLRIELFNPQHLRGVDALRFANLVWPRQCAREMIGGAVDEQSQFDKLTHWQRTAVAQWGGSGGPWVHVHKLGFVDAVSAIPPRDIAGELPGGWTCDGNGFAWRRQGDMIDMVLEMPTAPECADYGPTVDFELEVPVWEFFHSNDWRARLETDCAEKLRLWRESNQPEMAIADMIASMAASDVTISIAIVRRVTGACEPGCRQFAKQNRLPDEMLLCELAERPDVETLLQKCELRRTVAVLLDARLQRRARLEAIMGSPDEQKALDAAEVERMREIGIIQGDI